MFYSKVDNNYRSTIIYLLPLLGVLLCQPVYAQFNTCGNAVMQLQSYVAQVNVYANTMYYQQIPMICGYNQFCTQGYINQLSAWYMQQASMVDGWYYQIMLTCSSSGAPQSVPIQRPTTNDPGNIDSSTIEDIQVDDEDKTVRIRIPSTPKGFQ